MAKATRKLTTSRPKTTKVDVKRSAPVQFATPPIDVPQAESKRFISPPPSILGCELLKQLKRAIRDHELLDENECFDRSHVAISAAYNIANTLALVPPRGSEEALAAATILFGEASSLECFDEWPKNQRDELILRMKQRAAALAAWIECTHKVSRRDFRLDYFCPDRARDDVLPHTAAVLNVNDKKVAVL